MKQISTLSERTNAMHWLHTCSTTMSKHSRVMSSTIVQALDAAPVGEGVLVPANHLNELAAALVRLHMDSETRVRMAAAAKQCAEGFSVRVMTQSLRKTYLQLAAGGSA